MGLHSFVVAALMFYGSLFAEANASEYGRFGDLQRERLKRGAELYASREGQKLHARQLSDFRFYSNDTSKYLVESLPDVRFDIGEMYSGLVPIDTNNASRALFFVFQPTVGEPVDEITIWLNGGPGCSSLEGFFQENGLFIQPWGEYAPYINQYSWVNLTNMLWVEQPVGTGFSTGTPTATSEEDIAADFVKFFANFQDIFNISNFKIYVTGESYAGRYVSYISAAMLDQNDTTYFDLSGALVYNPCIGQYVYAQQQVPVVPYTVENNNIFNLNESFIEELEHLHEYCGFANFTDEFLSFPPRAVQPPVENPEGECDLAGSVTRAALTVNPCFNPYRIVDMCPILYDPLGFPTAVAFLPEGAQVYFNRTDVKTAMHAPLDADWSECASQRVFVGPRGSGPEGEGDLSADPIQSVLPKVIEATNRVLVSNGDYDMVILTQGTLLAIQNMTWGGKLGFQEEPATPINITLPDLQYQAVFEANGLGGVDGPQGIMGVQHFERGLMWAQTYQAGHMQPQFQPRVTYRHLQWLLGRIDTL